MGGGDPAGRYTDYYPAWLDHLADDVTIEGSLLDGAAQGAEAVRMIVGTIRDLYEQQEFNLRQFALTAGAEIAASSSTCPGAGRRRSTHAAFLAANA
jgi:hypothetical protein